MGNFNQIGTNRPWGKDIQIYLNAFFSKGDNNKRVEIH
jgi:hypothetical protein